MTHTPNTEASLDYIKTLLKHADAADFDKVKKGQPVTDDKVYKDVALAYIDVMIGRAQQAHCVTEVEHLTLAKQVMTTLKKDHLDIPWGTWFQGTLNDRLSETIEKAGGKKLLEWYDTHPHDHCGLDFTPPNLAHKKPASAQSK